MHEMSSRLLLMLGFLIAFSAPANAQEQVIVRVEVRSEQGAVRDAEVTAAGQTRRTDASGVALIPSREGIVRIVVSKAGFLEASTEVNVGSERNPTVAVDLIVQPSMEEEVVVVATTRTGRRLEDQPTRVEVLGREEIEEKMLMTPGDIVMMLNEMGGLRVQATSPSIGAASVRIQGMKGRYTRILSDGLPLFGQQVGGLGLLQIPPMDLGQVEVIKGAASALYGAGAMGGVVNLLSRRPGREPVRELLANRSTLGATDAVLFMSSPFARGWGASLLAGGHWQTRRDVDDDRWTDVAGYGRGIVRPRAFWEGRDGRSAFLTAGVTYEDRDGGTMPGAALPATGQQYQEALDTQRYDAGGSTQALFGDRYVVTARGAVAWQRHHHRFGTVLERDRHDTASAEVALRTTTGRHTWIAGLAYERDTFAPRDVPQFAYSHHVPGLFVQDDVDLAPWVSVSASGRADFHNEYGTFFSPRLAALFRAAGWTSRISVGQGFVASTPLIEDTEAAGLSTLRFATRLKAERGQTASLDVTRAFGPASYTVTVFGSRISDPVAADRQNRYELFNRERPTTNVGMELLATIRRLPFVATSTYTYVQSREHTASGREDAPLTPRHSAGLVGMWESEGAGRIGVELYYTGRQRLEANPYRDRSRPYMILGLLAERRLGALRAFVNAENLTAVRQTRWEPLLRPSQAVDGRWTVDAWAPLDGRTINGGVRLGF